MSKKYRVGIVGVGSRKLPDGRTRYGIAYSHAPILSHFLNIKMKNVDFMRVFMT